jgi:hypothetical protein
MVKEQWGLGIPCEVSYLARERAVWNLDTGYRERQ